MPNIQVTIMMEANDDVSLESIKSKVEAAIAHIKDNPSDHDEGCIESFTVEAEECEPERWVIEMSSEEFGAEEFEYGSKVEAIAGFNRLQDQCKAYLPEIKRTFLLIAPDDETEELTGEQS